MSLIVADVGGTNARLAFQKNINSEISLIENFLCSDFKSLEDIIKTYKQKHNIFNEHISIGVAGPCEDDDVLLSNNHIKFNKIELLKNFKLKSLLVINDFVAQSFVFKNLLLEEDEEKYKILFKKLKLKKIKNGTSKKNSTLLVTGPGTGLGVCNLKKIDNNVIPIPGEGGNTYFSPSNSEQIEILSHLLKSQKYVSVEDLVSGRGIENLFNFYQIKNKGSIKDKPPYQLDRDDCNQSVFNIALSGNFQLCDHPTASKLFKNNIVFADESDWDEKFSYFLHNFLNLSFWSVSELSS